MKALRIVLVCLSMVMAAACSPSGEGSDATDGGNGDNGGTPSTEAPDDGGATPTDAPDDGDGIALSLVCLEAAQAFSAAMQSYGASVSGGLSDEQAAEVEAQLEQWAEQAPDEIKDDFEIYGQVMSAYYEALGDIGLTPGATPTAEQLQALSEAADQIDQEALDAAGANITAWFDSNC